MNEFTSKKLGEVLAFLRLVGDTLDKGQAGFEAANKTADVAGYVGAIQEFEDDIEAIVAADGDAGITETKASDTLAKVGRARDDYIAGRWDNPVELYEWLSFNAGAGSSHSNEMNGAATKMNHESLQAVTSRAVDFFDGLLGDCKTYLYTIGQERA